MFIIFTKSVGFLMIRWYINSNILINVLLNIFIYRYTIYAYIHLTTSHLTIEGK